ncbi:hypothetical protein HanRHA438_Chr09g0397341 [Helianthus annuus]|nr:hypothetical protein HanRHA438_Chr09g0397341 [Helianthus annuus]
MGVLLFRLAGNRRHRRRSRRRPETSKFATGIISYSVNHSGSFTLISPSLLMRYHKEFLYATNVDVDDAWNLVGCLDTHLKICIHIVLFHYSCCCILFQNLVIDSLEME